jgi:hypothetical protein
MIITITEEHIKRGIRGSVKCCPVALAIAKKIPQGLVGIGNIAVHLSIEGTPRHVSLPLTTINAINQFDVGLGMVPFSFELPLEKYLPSPAPHQKGTPKARSPRVPPATKRTSSPLAEYDGKPPHHR